MSETRYEFDPGWTVRLTNWDRDAVIAAGSNLLVGNGFLGYRGTTPEQGADEYVALVVAGTYDCADGRWRELTTAPNPLYVEARSGDTPIRASRSDSAELALDLRTGEFAAAYRVPIDPHLLPAWNAMEYPVTWRGNRLDIRIEGSDVSIRGAAANPGPFEIVVRGRLLTIDPGREVKA